MSLCDSYQPHYTRNVVWWFKASVTDVRLLCVSYPYVVTLFCASLIVAIKPAGVTGQKHPG